MDSELVAISFTFIKVDVDESAEVTDADKVMEVFATLDVAEVATFDEDEDEEPPPPHPSPSWE